MVRPPVTEVRGTSVPSARTASRRHAVARRSGRLRRVLLAPVYSVYSARLRKDVFLPWQSVYSECYFTDVYWPAFRELDFLRALRSFQQGERRFGR
jgi:undecaprenyl pyrophosphate synthase